MLGRWRCAALSDEISRFRHFQHNCLSSVSEQTESMVDLFVDWSMHAKHCCQHKRRRGYCVRCDKSQGRADSMHSRWPDLKGWEEPRFYERRFEVPYSGRHIPAHSMTVSLV